MISIIIVSKDNEPGITKTMQSIPYQGNCKIQVIIKRYASVSSIQHDNNKVEVNGPDAGIYDAMNIATCYAHFDWMCYMNAGDKFACEMAELFRLISANRDADVLYGDHVIDGSVQISAAQPSYLRLGSAFCHQAAIIKRSAIGNGYNTKYRYAADYNFFVQAHTSDKSIKKLNHIICDIEAGGVSDTNRTKVFKEWRDIQHYYYGLKILSSLLCAARICKVYATNIKNR